MSLGRIPPWVAAYIGIPYKEGGRDARGADCWGLYSLVMAEQFGLQLPPYDGPSWGSGAPARAVGEAAAAYAKQFRTVPRGEEKLGDAILLNTYGFPVHLGMVVSSGLMLHVVEHHDSEIARYNSVEWASRLASFHRYDPE